MRSSELERPIHELVEILSQLGQAFGKLSQAMADNRAAFVAIDARRLGEGLAKLEEHWQAIEQLEGRRETILATIRRITKLEGSVRISTLATLCSGPLGTQLRRAADSGSVHGLKLVDALARFDRGDDPLWRSVAAQWFEWT